MRLTLPITRVNGNFPAFISVQEKRYFYFRDNDTKININHAIQSLVDLAISLDRWPNRQIITEEIFCFEKYALTIYDVSLVIKYFKLIYPRQSKKILGLWFDISE